MDKGLTIEAERELIKEAALWIKKGEVVAFPTETVYGLGGNALDDEAIEKIFLAKGRPSDNPLIVHVANSEQLEEFVEFIPDKAKNLMKEFWPGPLTIILPKKEGISNRVTAGLDTVAVRIPDHPVALALLEEANVPVAAPSANLSGKPSPTTGEHVFYDLNGRIAGIVDGGATGVGVESTVVDCTVDIPMILRPGGVTKEQLMEVIGEVTVDPALHEESVAPKSPGVKYTHYAPKATLTVVNDFPNKIEELVQEQKQKGYKVGVLTTDENTTFYQKADLVLPCGSRNDLLSVATNLYDVLRSFDKIELDYIYAEPFPKEGVGVAIMNRLEKAAGGRVI
nr:L-threonylcarbamoyladenylate synthase [Bacillus sp. FJAT-45350]